MIAFEGMSCGQPFQLAYILAPIEGRCSAGQLKVMAELRMHRDVAKPQIAKVVKSMQSRLIAPIQCNQFLSRLGPMMQEFRKEIDADAERETSIMELIRQLPLGEPRPFSRRPSK